MPSSDDLPGNAERTDSVTQTFGQAPPGPPEGASSSTATVIQTGTPKALQTDELPVIPGYRVLSEIARGGMGLVLAAHEAILDREVAIKVLLPGVSHTAARARFVTEARLTARLPHPAIPPIHELGTLSDGSPYLAMKLIRGRTLADELKNRASTTADLPRFLAIFEQVAQAVGFAHSQGVIHRDLKPANVMVGNFGEVQVMDWGIAKELSAPRTEPVASEADTPAPKTTGAKTRTPQADLTIAGTVMGTPAYMAPEQARGELERLGPWTDVFALGCILCDILTGSPPFVGSSSAEVLAFAASGEVRNAVARLAQCGADPELVSLASRCLSPKESDRPANGEAVATAIAAHRANTELRLRKAEAERAEAAVKAAEQRKRRQWQLFAAATAATLFVGVVAFAWWDNRRAHEQKLAEQREQANEEKREQARRDFLGRNAQDINAALTHCEEALRAESSDRAAVALTQAENRLIDGGGEAFTPRLARCRTDVPLLKELDAIDDLQWAVKDGVYQGTRAAAARWEKAFAQLGIQPGVTPSEEIARLVGGSLVRDRLLAALDRWFAHARTPELLAALKACDPDPYRNAVRAALRTGDETPVMIGEPGRGGYPTPRPKLKGGTLLDLVAQPEALHQPPRFAVVLGALQNVPIRRREQILRTVQQERPNDFTVLMTLGSLYAVGETASSFGETWGGPAYGQGQSSKLRLAATERAGWYHAATAARPNSIAAWNNLGVALKFKGDYEGAIAAGNVALRLDPKYAPAHNNLGNSFYAKGDLDSALAEYSTSVALDPTCPLARCNLGAVLWERGDLKGAEEAFAEASRRWPAEEVPRMYLDRLRRGLPAPTSQIPPPREVKRR